jgi:hypothetical protein
MMLVSMLVSMLVRVLSKIGVVTRGNEGQPSAIFPLYQGLLAS